MSSDAQEVTRLLDRLGAGDSTAADPLLDILYGVLRREAGRAMARQGAGHTLQPTALVHEAWMRLVRQAGGSRYAGREHFLRVASRAMRHVLVDHARAQGRIKRGAGETPVPLDHVLAAFAERALDPIELSDAVDVLTDMDEQLGRIVELRFFAGLTIAETAQALSISTPTVERGWRVARSWLRGTLGPGDS